MATVENEPGVELRKQELRAEPSIVADRPLRFVPTDTSFIDWDGMMAAVLFMGRCNMQCPFCHDHELFGPDAEPIPFDTIRLNLLTHREWIDGVVVTGGEPTCHSCLAKLLAEIKSMGFATKLDTNGTRPDVLQELVRDQLVDYVAMDLKASLNTRPVDNRGTTSYARAAGCPVRIDDIRASIDYLLEDHVDFLQPFEPHNARDSALRNVRPYSEQELALLLDLVRKYVPPATLRGAMR